MPALPGDDQGHASAWPPPSSTSLFEAARRGLATAPPETVQSAWFVDAVSRRGDVADLDPAEIRLLGAAALRAALDHDVESGHFMRRAHRLLYRRFGDLDPDEIANWAFLILYGVVERYELGVGKYGGREPSLFPVEKNYRAWTAAYVFRAARLEITNRRRMEVGGEGVPEPPAPPVAAPDLRDAAEDLFSRARSIALHNTPLHPDLLATLAGRQTEAGNWRITCTKLAAVEALNQINHGVGGEPVGDALSAARDALRTVSGPLKTIKMLDKRVSRYVGDVLYAVTESLRSVAGRPPTEPRAVLVWRYISIEVVRWHAAQLVAAVALLTDALQGEIGSSARIGAIVRWTQDLMAWVSGDNPHRDVVALSARAALDACVSEERAASPLERAREAMLAGTSEVKVLGTALVSLHDALIDFSHTEVAP